MEVDGSDETESISNESDLLDDDTIPVLQRNCPEKIVFVIDTEFDGRFFSNEEKFTFKESLHRCLKMFFTTKLNLSNEHEFAIMLLSNDNLEKHQGLTSSLNVLVKKVKDVYASINDHYQALAISIDDIVEKTLPTLNITLGNSNTPTRTTRFIFVLDKHARRFHGNNPNNFQAIDHPEIIMDFILLGGGVTSSNIQSGVAQENVNFIGNLNPDVSYIFDCSYETKDLLESFGKLLAHPLQRCQQRNAQYEINS